MGDLCAERDPLLDVEEGAPTLAEVLDIPPARRGGAGPNNPNGVHGGNGNGANGGNGGSGRALNGREISGKQNSGSFSDMFHELIFGDMYQDCGLMFATASCFGLAMLSAFFSWFYGIGSIVRCGDLPGKLAIYIPILLPLLTLMIFAIHQCAVSCEESMAEAERVARSEAVGNNNGENGGGNNNNMNDGYNGSNNNVNTSRHSESNCAKYCGKREDAKKLSVTGKWLILSYLLIHVLLTLFGFVFVLKFLQDWRDITTDEMVLLTYFSKRLSFITSA